MAEPIRITIYFDAQNTIAIRRGHKSLQELTEEVKRTTQASGGLSRAAKLVANDLNRVAMVAHRGVSPAMAGLNTVFQNTLSVAGRLARFGFYKLILEIGAVSYALQGLFREFIRVNEQFAGLEITLTSAFKSATVARQLREELVKITVVSPIPFEDLAGALRAVAVIPQLSTAVSRQAVSGTLGAPEGFFRRYMKLTEQMVAFRPDKLVKDVTFALREAITGELRSLIRRFDFPPGLLVAASGRPLKELRQEPMAMFDAIQKAMSRIITPQAVRQLAFQPSKLFENIMEQIKQIPMLYAGDAGFYQAFLESPYFYDTLLYHLH